MKPFKPHSSEEILDMVEKAESVSSATCDGPILATIIMMIFNYGFSIENFRNLKIKDVVDSKGQIKWPFNSSQPTPFDDFTESIQSHLGYLKEKAYSVNKKAPLFPQLKQDTSKQKSPGYHHRELRRDLKDYAGITCEQLRRDGIHYYYKGAKEQGFEDEEVVDYLANLFREEKNTIIETLNKGGVKLPEVKKERGVKAPLIKPAPVRPTKQMIGGGRKKNDSEKTNISVLWNTENKDPFKDFDDGDTEDGYWEDDED